MRGLTSLLPSMHAAIGGAKAHLKFMVSSASGNRDFKLYLLSQALRLWGWGIQAVAVTWLVYSTSKSALVLALVGFSNFIPLLCLGLTAGWLADRVQRRKILLVTQALNIAIMLGFYWQAADPSLLPVLALCFASGLVFVYDQPTRQAFLLDLVAPDKRVTATSFNLSICTTMQMAGLATAGLVISLWGEPACFLLTALAYTGTEICVWLMGPKNRERSASQTNKKSGSHSLDTIRFIWSRPEARRIFIQSCIVTMFVTKYIMVFPLVAERMLDGGAGTLALLSAANSIGATFAALFMAGKAGTSFLRKLPTAAMLFVAPVLFVFGLSGSLALSTALVIVLGVLLTLQSHGNYALLQTMLPDKIQGSAIALYLLVSAIADQLGSLMAGYAEKYLGLEALMYAGAIASLLYFVWFRKHMRKGNGECEEQGPNDEAKGPNDHQKGPNHEQK